MPNVWLRKPCMMKRIPVTIAMSTTAKHTTAPATANGLRAATAVLPPPLPRCPASSDFRPIAKIAGSPAPSRRPTSTTCQSESTVFF